MPTDSATPQTTSAPEPSALLDPGAWLSHHPRIAICIGAFCLWVSLCLIIRLWVVHSRVPLYRRLIWSLVLLIPFFGWLAYGGGFHVPLPNDSPCAENPDAGTGGGWV